MILMISMPKISALISSKMNPGRVAFIGKCALKIG
jgi:hypothetical protein